MSVITVNERLGLQKTSLIDYPGRIAAVIFFTGCNLRCPFCHNPALARGKTPPDFLSAGEVMSFLRKRSSVLSGVCITGGEPTLHDDLPELVERIHALGLAVKIDTNGLNPRGLSRCQPDYVALDLKTAPQRYDELRRGSREQPSTAKPHSLAANPKRCGSNRRTSGIFDSVAETMRFLRDAGCRYEYRTTVAPELVGPADAEAIMGEIEPGERWFLQGYRPDVVLEERFGAYRPTADEELNRLCSVALERGIDCRVRGARNGGRASRQRPSPYSV